MTMAKDLKDMTQDLQQNISNNLSQIVSYAYHKGQADALEGLVFYSKDVNNRVFPSAALEDLIDEIKYRLESIKEILNKED